MKKAAFFVLFMAGVAVIKANTTSLSLFEAIQKKMVKAEIRGRGYSEDNSSSHYGKCISMTIKNISSSNLNLSLQAGSKLPCIYDSVQDMLVGKTEMFALNSGTQSDFTIHAFCSEKYDRSPGATSRFLLAGLESGYLYELVLLIERLNSFDRTGQAAVWSLTDNAPVENISGDNPYVVEQLRNYVNFAKNAGSYMKEGVIYDYSFPKKSGELFTIEGTFDWEMPCTSGATLSIYDNKGKMLLCVFTDVVFNKGLHTYKYSITDPAFKAGETYWMRLTACNYRVKEIAITMD